MKKVPRIASLCILFAFSAASLVVAQTKGTLVFGLSGNPDTLDPQKTAGTLTFQVVKSFYDTLVEPNTDGTIVPALRRAGQSRLMA